MNLNVAKELAALKRLGVRDLRDKFAEVYGDTTPSGNKAWLIPARSRTTPSWRGWGR